MNRAREEAAASAPRRGELKNLLEEAGKSSLAASVGACGTVWKEGHLWRCKAPRFCELCFRLAVSRATQDDAVVLRARKTGAVFFARTPTQARANGGTWKRFVLGHRRLPLPRSARFLWIVVLKHKLKCSEQAAVARVEGRLPGASLGPAPADLGVLYREAIAEMQSLTPAALVANAVATGFKKTRLFGAGGIFKIPRPPKRRGKASRPKVVLL